MLLVVTAGNRKNKKKNILQREKQTKSQMKYKKVKIFDAMRSVVDWMDGWCVCV